MKLYYGNDTVYKLWLDEIVPVCNMVKCKFTEDPNETVNKITRNTDYGPIN